MGEGVDAHSVKLVDVATMKLVREIDVGRVPPTRGLGMVVDVRFADGGRTVVVSVAPNAPDGPPPYRCDGMTRAPAGPWDPGVRIGRGPACGNASAGSLSA